MQDVSRLESKFQITLKNLKGNLFGCDRIVGTITLTANDVNFCYNLCPSYSF